MSPVKVKDGEISLGMRKDELVVTKKRDRR
jgi:hypothetical protein